MIKWLHHLFNPHCPDCLLEREHERECRNCEVLMNLLDKEKFEKRQLLDRLLYVPKNEPVDVPEDLKPVNISKPSLRIVRETLERESQARAQILQKKNKEIEELEKELLPSVEIKEDASQIS